MNDSWARRAGAIAMLCFAALASAQDGPQKLAQVRLNAGIHNINAELASTPQQREIGLMFRTAMPANDGMLFAFEQPGQQCFWMRNTLIPLSIAFIRGDGRILEIQDMQPQTTDFHKPAERYRSALEVNQGYFTRNGIKAGDRAELPLGSADVL